MKAGARELELHGIGMSDVSVSPADDIVSHYDGEVFHLSWNQPFEVAHTVPQTHSSKYQC